MKLDSKIDKIKKLNNIQGLTDVVEYLYITNNDFYEIKFSIFELKESIKRLEQYLYYSDTNPFVDNVSYVSYARFIYESYLNDVYIIQTRFRKLINSIANEKKFYFEEKELEELNNNYKDVVKKVIKITKDKRGEHVHNKRYNDLDFMIVDVMERQNRINKMIKGLPLKEYEGKDLYYEVTVTHLDDVQNMIIDNNNYVYETIDDFLKEILDFIMNKIELFIEKSKNSN